MLTLIGVKTKYRSARELKTEQVEFVKITPKYVHVWFENKVRQFHMPSGRPVGPLPYKLYARELERMNVDKSEIVKLLAEHGGDELLAAEAMGAEWERNPDVITLHRALFVIRYVTGGELPSFDDYRIVFSQRQKDRQ